MHANIFARVLQVLLSSQLKIWYPFNYLWKFSINIVLIIIINEISKQKNVSSSQKQTEKFDPIFPTELLRCLAKFCIVNV